MRLIREFHCTWDHWSFGGHVDFGLYPNGYEAWVNFYCGPLTATVGVRVYR